MGKERLDWAGDHSVIYGIGELWIAKDGKEEVWALFANGWAFWSAFASNMKCMEMEIQENLIDHCSFYSFPCDLAYCLISAYEMRRLIQSS